MNAKWIKRIGWLLGAAALAGAIGGCSGPIHRTPGSDDGGKITLNGDLG